MTTTTGIFQQRYRHLRRILQHPESFRYVLHTSLGPLAIGRITGYPDQDVTIITGADEKNNWKTYVFNEGQLASYPIELVPEKATDKPIGFAAGKKVEDVL
jgi:hypothetical protein